MQPRLFTLVKACRGSAALAWGVRPVFLPRASSLIGKSCRNKFSTSPALRWVDKAKEVPKTAGRDLKYKSRLLIYDAGDIRTTWVSFWKAIALLQFGTTLVFGVPPLWNNSNQPDPNVRKFQAILVGILGTIPTMTLAYVTAPFVHQVFLQIPEYARRSKKDLHHFAKSLRVNPRATANTKLEFVTLRIFPFRKNTAAFLHELRALPPKRFRLANIELPKTKAWAQRQREKGMGTKLLALMNEPRFKFHVKEGRLFTLKTGVPGVWEEVAARIQQQTLEEQEAQQEQTGLKQPAVVRKPMKLVTPVPSEIIKRQTSRPITEIRMKDNPTQR